MKILLRLLFVLICSSVFAALSISADTGKAGMTPLAHPTPTPKAALSEQEQLAKKSFKRLLDLQSALKKIPIDKQDKEPHRSFLKTNEKDITYSDPSAEYYVRSDLFWDLHEKHKNLPIGEEIAWAAAQNPLPGECEGYVNCYVYLARSTNGKYLSFYPNGKYSRKALLEISGLLEPIVSDPADKPTYTGPGDSSDRAELTKLLGELNSIVSKVPHQERSNVLLQIKQLGERFLK